MSRWPNSRTALVTTATTSTGLATLPGATTARPAERFDDAYGLGGVAGVGSLARVVAVGVVVHHHVCPGGGHGRGAAAPNAPRGARDQRHLAGEAGAGYLHARRPFLR